DAVSVRTSLWRRREQGPKTIASVRTVEISEPAANRIAEFAKRRSGFLFGNGHPPSESAFRDRLNRILPGLGFHSTRRFRTTWLRKQGVSEELIKYWLGHSRNESITDRYSKIAEDAEYRRTVCEKTGVGFALPEVMQTKGLLDAAISSAT